MPAFSWADRRVVITGASSGVGRELAIQLVPQGARLIITARRDDALRELCQLPTLAGADVQRIAGDLTCAATRDEIAQLVQQSWGAVDVVISNAGVGGWGPVIHSTDAQTRAIFDLNLFAPAELMRALYPQLLKGSHPMIIQVGSILSHIAAPRKGDYCASKFAVRGLMNTLRMELHRDGIHVMLVSPSTIASEFFDRLLFGKVDAHSTARASPAMSAADVARQIIRAAPRRPRELFLPWYFRYLVPFHSMFPGIVDWLLLRSLRDGPKP